MTRSRRAAKKVAETIGDTAVSTIGNAAGAVVAPKTALSKVRRVATSPAFIGLVMVGGIAFWLGRRGHAPSASS